MKWLSRIFDFYVNGSIHVSFAAIAFLIISVKTLNINVSEQLIYFVFFASIATYNFLKYGHSLISSLKNGRKDIQRIFILSILSLFFGAMSCIHLPFRTIPLLVVLLTLLLMYNFPIFPRDRNLRSLGLLKVIIVAFTWTGVTVLLPYFADQELWLWDTYVLALQRFLFILAMMIPFEIRDMYLDPPGIKTLPRKFGVLRTKYLGLFLAWFSFSLTYLKDEIAVFETASGIFATLLLSVFITRTPSYPSRYYASFWVEALPVFWLLFIEIFW